MASAGIPMGQPVGVPVAAASVASPAEILASTPAVFVQQVTNLFEVLSGCEMRNQYKIYECNPETREKTGGYPLFMAQEESECCQRQCCGSNRAFTMDFCQRHPTEEKGRGPTLMSVDRPFKCTCLCLNRPVMHVKDPSGMLIGEVYAPFTCCNYQVQVRAPTIIPDGASVHPAVAEAKRGEWYTLTGSICQPAAFCSCPCGPCKRFVFEMTDPTGARVGELCHVWPGCVKEAFTDSDNYSLIFPADATWYQKSTLTAAAIMIDFLYFEKNQDDNNHA